MTPNVTSPWTLSKYPPGSLRELSSLSFPIILSLFSASFMGFCDRFFLCHYSLEGFQAAVHAGYLCLLFQLPLIKLVSMTQVFVGLYSSSNQTERIGPSVWQMIWLSIFSMLFTFPLGRFVAPFFLNGSSIQNEANIYFTTLMTINFLFPLGATLASYFMGRGETKIIFLATLLSHGINIGLDYILIFGLKDFLPSLGVFGAALSTGISQGIYCVILFASFLNKEDKEKFHTHLYKFNWDNFWGQLKIGLPRAIARVIILSAWSCISRLMTLKGGDYLLVLSIGGSLILLFTFINEGMLQGMITVASHLMGSKDYKKIWKLVRSGFALVFIMSILLAIPYLILPEFTLSFFFHTPPSAESLQILKKTCLWLWFFFFCTGVHIIGQSLVTASRDVTFYMYSIIFVWVTSYVPVYLAMEIFHASPDKLWLIMGLDAFLYGILFIARATKEKWKERENDFDISKTLSQLN